MTSTLTSYDEMPVEKRVEIFKVRQRDCVNLGRNKSPPLLFRTHSFDMVA